MSQSEDKKKKGKKEEEEPKALPENIHKLFQSLECQAREHLAMRATFEEEKKAFVEMRENYRRTFPLDGEVVRFNVGGRKFETLVSTIRRKPSFLLGMVSGEFPVIRDPKGAIFIDRNPDLFEWVLEYLRTGELPELAPQLRGPFRNELAHYGLAEDLPELRWTWDPAHKNTNINLSSDNLTMTVGGTTNHSSCFGNTGFTAGTHRWCIELNINGDHWAAIGVRRQPSDYTTDYSEAWAHSSSNQRYPSSTSHTETADNRWLSGDVIVCELNCDEGRLTLTNRRTSTVETRTGISGEVFPWVNLYNSGNWARLFFE